MSYPKSFQYLVSRLGGYSKTNMKLRPMSQASAQPNDVIVFELPANTIVDLRTFSVFAKATTTATGGTNPTVVLPKHVESVIDSIQIEVNGTLIDSGFSGYNQVHKLYMDYFCGTDKSITTRCLMQQGDLTSLGHTGGSVGASTIVASRTMTNVPVVLNSFLGFLSAKCPIIDTSILGTVRVMFRLAPTSILVVGGAPATFNYSLSELFATIDVISMNDGMYYDYMIQQRLSGGQVLEVMYDRHYVFQNGSVAGAAQTTRWAVNTQSLDWVIGTHFADVSRTAPNTLDAISNTSQFFKRDGSAVVESSFQFNNVQYPNHTPNNTDGTVLVSTLQNLNVLQDLVSGSDIAMYSYNNWRNSFYAHIHRFNHLPGADDDNRLISGLNTLGTNSQGTYVTTGAGGTYWPYVIVKTTGCLRIGAGRSLEVVP